MMRPLALGLLALLAVTAGCSDKGSPVVGDTGGFHLVAFASDRDGGQYDVFLYDLDERGFRLLRDLNSTVADDLQPAITSDGIVVAWVSARGPTGDDIQLFDRSSFQYVTPPGLNGSGSETEPAFTDDGLKLVFVQGTSGVRRIRMFDGVPDTLVALPGLEGPAGTSDWSPAPNVDGSRIAFVSDRFGGPDVLVWDRSTHSLVNAPLLRSAGDDVEPWLSREGRFVWFASNRPGGLGGYDLYRYDIMESVLDTLPGLNGAFDERHPSGSRDNNVIAFQSNREAGNGHDVLLYSVSNRTVSRFTGLVGAAADVTPALRWR